MWPVFPTADYYERSASPSRLGDTFPSHRQWTFPSSHAGLKRNGWVAGRSLCPCLPQVDAEAAR